MTDLVRSITQLQSAYCDAVSNRDVQALIALYDAEVRVFDAWGVWLYPDAAAWQRAIQGWFESLGADTVKVRFQETVTLGSPELALSSSIVTYAAQSPKGEELQAMQNRITWGVRDNGHGPRIVHEHTSAPIRFEDMKAILQRG